VSEPEDPTATDPRNPRRPWTEGPDEEAPRESWLSLGDDELLHRIESRDAGSYADDTLVEIVRSERHFFIRQEAAKKVKDRNVLFPFEDDRHIGQILVRHLTRREDVTYLERLAARSRHAEVRAAAQVQLAQLWGRLGGPSRIPDGEEAPPPPEFVESGEMPPPADEEIDVPIEMSGTAATDPAGVSESAPVLEEAEAAAAVAEKPAHPPPAPDGVDGSLLGWAVHFVVEQVWAHLDTRAARGLLLRTHAELLPFQPVLSFFRVEKDAHVHVDLSTGPRLPAEAVEGVGKWMAAFLAATRASVTDMEEVDVRQSTRLMGDALEEVGFYRAFRDADEA
jgi:hypothetical protein